MFLASAQMEHRLDNAPRKNMGKAIFSCPNCGKEHERTIWGTATEIDETGKLTYDFYHASAQCGCGASLMIADDYESWGCYWLNKKEMTQVTHETRRAPDE